MHILGINYEYPPLGGGGGYVTRDIFERLVELGHNVTVLTSGYRGLPKDEKVNGVRIIRVPVLLRRKLEVASTPSMLSYLPSSLSAALLRLRKLDFDIINTHFAVPSGPTGWVLSKIFKIPNILYLHGGDIYDPSKPLSPHKTPLLAGTVGKMINTADRVVAQSSNTRENACKYYRVKKPIDIIPLGIRPPVFKSRTRADFNLDGSEIVLCSIGRLIARKNIDDALAVLSRLKENYRFKFLVIGDGPGRARTEALIRQLGLEDAVRLMGNVSDEEKFQLLSLSDIYISTSMHEGFGLVYLEAMACGLPVLCYDTGGQTDFLINGETGFLARQGSLEQFGTKLIELISRPGLSNKMAAFNREHVKSYTIQSCVEKHLCLFEKTISDYGKS